MLAIVIVVKTGIIFSRCRGYQKGKAVYVALEMENSASRCEAIIARLKKADEFLK